MIRVANRMIPSSVHYVTSEYGVSIEILIPPEMELSDTDITEIKNAEIIEEFENNYGEIGGVKNEYALVCWQSVERTPVGMYFRWQTYRDTDINQIKQDNEDLTQALLELAQIVGGDNG